MSGYTDSEKIQYALKTALYRTMQTAMSDSASDERSAPLRVFPTNIMKVNIIEAGKGDIDEDGKYITGHTNAGTTANLLDPEGTVKNYKIICPVNNVITDKTISWLVGYGSSTKSYIDGRGTTGTSYPLKQWFFRGHYSGTGEAAFDAASAAYTGLQLAWNSSTDNTTPSEADIVPHLKYYLQVQTKHTGISHEDAVDNMTYEHDLLKGLIGLDSNFVSTIMVTQGEGGPTSCASLGTSGSQAGDFWFTQPSSGILSFYGVTNKVDASTDLASFNTKFPMISYVRYTGETGFGDGGGGGSVTLASADSNVSTMIGGTAQTMTTTSFNFDGNVGIGTTSPYAPLHASCATFPSTDANNPQTYNSTAYANVSAAFTRTNSDGGNRYGLFIGNLGNTGASYLQNLSTTNNVYYNLLLQPNGGNVGIGTTSPGSTLEIKDVTSGTAGEVESILKVNSVSGYHMVSLGTAGPSNYHSGSISIYKTLSATGTTKSVHLSGSTDDTYFNGDGNVGIGTSSPQTKLHVETTITTNDTTVPMDSDALNNTVGLYLSNRYSASFNYGVILGSLYNATGYIQSISNDGNGRNLVLNPGGGNVGIGTSSPDRGLCILDNQNTGQAIGNYYIGYDTRYQEPGALKIFQHLPITSGTYRISDGGGNLDPAINIITNFIGSGATSATHQGGCIQWTTQSRDNPTSGGAHGQPYAAIYGGRHSDIANHEGEMIFYTSDTTNRASGPNLNPRMTIKGGNVGIGTTSPDDKLHVQGGGIHVYCNSAGTGNDAAQASNAGNANIFMDCNNNPASTAKNGIIWKSKYSLSPHTYTKTSAGIYFQPEDNYFRGGLAFYTNGTGDVSTDATEKMRIDMDGNVGIGTTSPWTGLHVEASHGDNYHQAYNSFLWETGYTYDLWTSGNHIPQWSDNYSYFSIYSNRAILIRNGGIWSASDKRIKMNIEDVPDNISLEMLRNIPCRYYQYKDPTRQNGNKKTIGFIAQEVDEIFPIAITKKEDLIPSEMRLLVENENAIWTHLSDNTCKLYITDLEDAIPNTECLFILSDSSDNIIEKKIQVLDDGKSFIFKKKWNKVFLHSKMVSDFHVVDKQKLFSLNFSATQELDRQQQADKAEIAELKTEVATLKSELAAIKQHLGI